MTRMRFATWNIAHSRKSSKLQAQLLQESRADVVALQEVTTSCFDALHEAGVFTSFTHSLTLRPPAPSEGRGRSLGCAIFARSPFEIDAVQLLDTPLPERSLVATIRTPEGPLTACSFHAPPGSTWGTVKPASFRAIADWLASRASRTIFGMDANTPKSDRLDPRENIWWWPGEETLLGAEPSHHLRDVLRTLISGVSTAGSRFSAIQTDGPLAVSYRRGAGKRRYDCRYDVIYATPDIDVLDVQYRYTEAIAAGSDHALVVADLVI